MVITTIRCVAFIFLSLTVQVKSQICHGITQNDPCSTNTACGCLHMPSAIDTGICGFRYVTCSGLVACESSTNRCYEPRHICVNYPDCYSHPVCFPMSMADAPICPLMTITNNRNTTTSTTPQSVIINQKWKQHAITVAGGYEKGNRLNQLSSPHGIFVDNDRQCMYIADYANHRILEWTFDANNGKIVAGGNGQGSKTDQLDRPVDVIVDKKNDSLIICDGGNNRLVEWSRQNDRNGQTIISGINCWGIAMDKAGDFYISDTWKNEVRRWKRGDTQGIIVAGGNGYGNQLNQLVTPTYLFVDDDDQSVYVSDRDNHRVMKWMKGAKEGIVVAGGDGKGSSLSQLTSPMGVIVDQWGNVYVADNGNSRIMFWSKGAKESRVIVGGNGEGKQTNQFNHLRGISFDRQGQLYIVDWINQRVQKFALDNQ